MVDTIGVIGGSITGLATVGARALGDLRWWDMAARARPGSTVLGGAKTKVMTEERGDKYWERIDALQVDRPAGVVWWMLLEDDTIPRVQTYYARSVLPLLDKIKLHIPTATRIYVSGMPWYGSDSLCPVKDSASPMQCSQMVGWLMASGDPYLRHGPYMPALDKQLLGTGRDVCHQNAQGQAVHGAVLRDYLWAS